MSTANPVEDRPAGLWRRWLWRPKSTWMRKVLFQLHLWSGLMLGLYVVVVCASGSALVFRNDIYDWLESTGKASPYKGVLYHWLSWLGKLHGSLLMEGEGMTANAIGGFLLAALCLTGIIVWWPGLGSWRRALTMHAGAGWRRLVVDLHTVVGFWTFAILLMWGLTGGYFVFPQPFRAAIGFFTPITAPPVIQAVASVQGGATLGGFPNTGDPKPLRRRVPLTLGARILRGFSNAHYGNFGGWGVKILWVILGLAPAVLLCSAVVMWSNRVAVPALQRWRRNVSL